ncbi:MAG: radical SAM protein [Nitrospirae bacterium]|nr:MAG: radical SAM protein [Nitrospirota bacterium]
MSINNPYEFFVQLHLTERCNLSCSHCYQDRGSSSDEMSLAEIRSVIGEVSDMLEAWTGTYDLDFTSSFNVTGGEPFLRQDIFKVLEELQTKGFDAYLLTNGTLINPDMAASLAGLGLKGVQISIEGPQEVHDAIRGRGSFAASLKGIRNLLDADLEVTLNTTLSGMNAPYFMDVIELASSLGVQRLGFSRLVPSGSGEKLLDSMLGREALKALYGKIFSLNTGRLKIVTGDPVASQFRVPAEADGPEPRPSGGCAAGVSGLTILPDGTVTPCRRLPVPLGNVRQDSLREIWASSEMLNRLRDRSAYEGRCGSCGAWSSCRGCRAIAYAFSRATGAGSSLAEDPQCFLTS